MAKRKRIGTKRREKKHKTIKNNKLSGRKINQNCKHEQKVNNIEK